MQKLVRTNVQALSWKPIEAWRPVGVRFSASTQPDTVSATGGSGSAASAVPATVAAKAQLLSQKNSQLDEARQRIVRIIQSFLLPVTRP